MIAFLITKLVEYVKDTRIGYGDIKSSFEELLRKDNSVKIHDKYIASSTEIYRVKNGLSFQIINHVFEVKSVSYHMKCTCPAL